MYTFAPPGHLKRQLNPSRGPLFSIQSCNSYLSRVIVFQHSPVDPSTNAVQLLSFIRKFEEIEYSEPEDKVVWRPISVKRVHW